MVDGFQGRVDAWTPVDTGWGVRCDLEADSLGVPPLDGRSAVEDSRVDEDLEITGVVVVYHGVVWVFLNGELDSTAGAGEVERCQGASVSRGCQLAGFILPVSGGSGKLTGGR